VALRVRRGSNRKKISSAYEQSVAAAEGTEEEKEQKGSDTSGDIIKKLFGDELLFICYEYMREMHGEPRNWYEFFDFLKYMKVKGTLKEIAMAAAKAGRNNE